MTPKISIITIVFNDIVHIEGTILSVLNQSYANIEYLIIDGGSTDGTLDIIKKYSDRLGYWVSENDKGIYDAMNKGLRAATGDFVWFINSGDRIYENDTVQKLVQCIEEDSDVVYGENVLIDDTGKLLGMRRKKAPKKLSWKNFINGMVVCHQSVLVRRTLAPEYNETYKFSADFEWVLLSLKRAKKVVNAHQILSRYLEEGMTTKNLNASLKERYRIMVNYYGLIPTVAKNIWLGIGYFLFIKKNKGNYRPIE